MTAPVERASAPNGWQRRFVAGPPRLLDCVRLYESLGYDVRLEPLEARELDDRCAGCRVALTLFRVVYTRRKS